MRDTDQAELRAHYEQGAERDRLAGSVGQLEFHQDDRDRAAIPAVRASGDGRHRRRTRLTWSKLRCYAEHGCCYTLDLSQVDKGQSDIREMITISDSIVKDAPALAAAVGLESRAVPEPGIPWHQIEAGA